MRKASESQRFPQSAVLFKFCLRVLEVRKPDAKVHDQDVGNILDYNPSDTSHWKRGKKAVRSIFALEALSRELDVDIELIEDIASGAIDFDEAWFDFTESEEESRQSKVQGGVSFSKSRRDRQLVMEEIANTLNSRAGVNSVPVFLPELMTSLPFIQLVQADVTDRLARSNRIKPGQYVIRYRKGDLTSHIRCAISREVARIILLSEREQFMLPPRSEDSLPTEIIDLANALLVPSDLLKAELTKVPARANMVQYLANLFWVPKVVVRSRLVTLLMRDASEGVFNAPAVTLPPKRPTPGLTNAALLSEDDYPAGGRGQSGSDDSLV
ncbi:MAG: hypothetical protein FJY29_08360 [Betaproteobacteria bacterium]|nr:hypothetical protein [Betaproteobacteria bacterium]